MSGPAPRITHCEENDDHVIVTFADGRVVRFSHTFLYALTETEDMTAFFAAGPD